MHVDMLCSAKGLSAYNEDAVGCESDFAWVIDGASSVFPERYLADSDSAFLANELNDELYAFAKMYNSDSGLGEFLFADNASRYMLPSILEFCLGNVFERAVNLNPNIVHVESYKLPSFAIAMVRQVGNSLEYFMLCDCFLLRPGHTPLTDDRFERIKKMNRGKISELGIAKDPDRKLDVYRDARKLLNVPDIGYWVGTMDAIGIKHGVSGFVDIGDDESIALCTDGFYDYFLEEDINPAEWDVSSDNVFTGFAKLYENYRIDPNGSETARPKGRDDASIIVFTL